MRIGKAGAFVPSAVGRLFWATIPRARIRWLCGCGLLAWAGFAQAAPVRVAILPEKGAEAAADLLTASLSGYSQIELVERDQMERIARERGLEREAICAWGTLQGAQIVIVISEESGPVETGASESSVLFRVFATEPGTILGFVRTRNPGDASADILHLIEAMPEPGENWIPVSVINFRFDHADADAARIERDLTGLISSRLSAQPGILVLERARLLQAVVEKAMSGKDDPFWTGAYLIEGQLQRVESRLRVQLRLKPPNGGAPFLLPVQEISAIDLPAGAHRISEQVAEWLGASHPGAVVWAREKEAAALFSEATWCFRQRRYQDALNLAEASLALGRSDSEGWAFRIRTESHLAYPHPNIHTMLFASSWCSEKPSVITATGFPQAFRYARMALTDFLDGCDSRLAVNSPKEKDFYCQLAVYPVAAASHVLRQMYLRGLDAEFTEEAAGIRALIRQIREKVRRTDFVTPGVRIEKNRMQWWNWTEFTFATYWFETVADAVAAHRDLLRVSVDEDLYREIRQRLACSVGELDRVTREHPYLTSCSDRPTDASLDRWSQFVKDLRTDPDPLIRLDGHVAAGALGYVGRTKKEWTAQEETRNQAIAILMEVADTVISNGSLQTYSLLLGTEDPDGKVDPRWYSLLDAWVEKTPYLGPEWFDVHTGLLSYGPPHVGQLGRPVEMNIERVSWFLQRFKRLRERFPSARHMWIDRMEVALLTAHSELYPRTEVQSVRMKNLVASINFPENAWSPTKWSDYILSDGVRIWFLCTRYERREGTSGWPPQYEYVFQIHEVHPPSGAFRVVYDGPGGSAVSCGPAFIHCGAYLYLISANRVARIDPGTDPTSVEVFPIHPGGGYSHVVLDGVLYRGGSEGLVAVNLRTGDNELIASIRRRPAQTPLDDRGSIELLSLFRGPDGMLWLQLFNRRVLRYDPRSKAWDRPFGDVEHVTHYNAGRSHLFATDEGVMWTIEDGLQPAAWIMRNPHGHKAVEPTFSVDMAPTNEVPMISFLPKWRNRVSAYDGRRLWSLSPPTAATGWRTWVHDLDLATGKERVRRIERLHDKAMQDRWSSILPNKDGLLLRGGINGNQWYWIPAEEWDE